jgi:NAD(P)H-flavin reductase/ferredoxin
MMTKTCKVVVNGEAFAANRGDLLLDAALMNGIDIPHDCRSGHCGTCLVRVMDGRVFGGQTVDPKTVHACQCRVISDLRIAVEEVPEVETVSARVANLQQRASDVMEVRMELSRPLFYFPGQYCRVQFRGFPARCYSPTVPLDGPADERFMHLHVRIVPNGRISSALGGLIREGHRVKLTGPLGSAYLRPNHRHRLVLISGGTGFAPIWSIADAAMWERPDRELVLIVGARDVEGLYMIPALCRLARCRNVTIIPVISEGECPSQAVRTGMPTQYMPKLTARDVIFTCGPPPMVKAISEMAQAAGATCYADPFVPAGAANDQESLLTRARAWLNGEPRTTSAAPGTAKLKPPPQQRPVPAYARPAKPYGPRPGYGAPFGAPRRYATES